jgi:Ca2+-transporting ATPase
VTSSTQAAVPAVPPSTAEPAWHTLSADQVLGIQAVAELDGLSPAEAASRAERFSLFNLFFSIAAKDELKTVFSLDTFSDKTFVISTGLSVLAIILATVLGPLQKFLDTISLDVQQWLICLAVSLSIIVISEIRKAILRRSARPAAEVTGPARQAAAVAA